jgi:hypothetical protein
MRAKCVCLFSEIFETSMQVVIENHMFHLREFEHKNGQMGFESECKSRFQWKGSVNVKGTRI